MINPFKLFALYKGNEYNFKGGDSVETVLPSLLLLLGNGSTLKGKNLLTLGANSFLLE